MVSLSFDNPCPASSTGDCLFPHKSCLMAGVPSWRHAAEQWPLSWRRTTQTGDHLMKSGQQQPFSPQPPPTSNIISSPTAPPPLPHQLVTSYHSSCCLYMHFENSDYFFFCWFVAAPQQVNTANKLSKYQWHFVPTIMQQIANFVGHETIFGLMAKRGFKSVRKISKAQNAERWAR